MGLAVLAAIGGMAVACRGGDPSGDRPGGTGFAGPSPAADRALIEWQRLREPRERVAVGLGGLWRGPADGRRAHYLFAGRQSQEDLALFARTYAAFRQADALGELVFRGHGTAPAGAAERRMIGEWARRVAAEAAGDGSPSPYGLAFAWHRGVATGGVCDDLAVFLSGEVRAGSCGAGVEAQGRLAGDRLARLYAWVDELHSFQAAGEQSVRADALLERLIFAGRGQRAASSEVIADMEDFAASLHHQVQAASATAPGSAAAVVATAEAPLSSATPEKDDTNPPPPQSPD